MTSRQKNKLRAFFLLAVFSLNTVMGFACSLGVDMGYNSEHHAHEKHNSLKLHSHPSGHKHEHTGLAISGTTIKGVNNDCCTNGVTRFTLLDKAITHPLLLHSPAFFIEIRDPFLFSLQEEVGATANSRFRFVRRSCFLNDIDIQTATRRFQI